MFEWLASTGHEIVAPVPSLFTFNIPDKSLNELMGISLTDALVKIPSCRLQQRGPLLITHWGLSGPAVLALSAWGARELHQAQYDFDIAVNWLPEFHENSLRESLLKIRAEHASQKAGNRNPYALPERFWKYQLTMADCNPDIRWADMKAVSLNKLAKNMTGQMFRVKGKTTFKEEFVTAGGISLHDIEAHTLESKKIPGLYFAGEIMDVDGVTGGFNFQHAWTSGWLAAHLNSVNKRETADE
jgi:predicted Rossmann fold flavoprotein